MAGAKTIELPDDVVTAKEQLATMLVDPAPYIYLFLFGDDQETQLLATKADLYAGGDQFETERRVVVAKSFTPLADCFTALPRADGVEPVDTPGTAASPPAARRSWRGCCRRLPTTRTS